MDVEGRETGASGREAMNEEREQTEARWKIRELLLFFLRFLGASIVLYTAYLLFGKYYSRLIALIAGPLLAAFGYRVIMEQALSITEEIALNPVVFLSLVIAVGKIPWRLKLRAAAIGVVVLTAANSITVFLAFMSQYRHSERLWTGTEFLDLTMNFFVPILLWLILLPIRRAFPFFGKIGE
jgi:hypothetical protein